MHCATFPRHLGKHIVRGLIAHPNGLDTVELVRWAYGAERPVWALGNIRRHCRKRR